MIETVNVILCWDAALYLTGASFSVSVAPLCWKRMLIAAVTKKSFWLKPFTQHIKWPTSYDAYDPFTTAFNFPNSNIFNLCNLHFNLERAVYTCEWVIIIVLFKIMKFC